MWEHSLERKQFVGLARNEVFNFFARAENLEEITPPWLNFKIVRKSTEDVGEGTLIDYRLKIHGFPVTWRTRICEWSPGFKFVDEQLKGPYAKWRHVHIFEDAPGGTLLIDRVTYRPPFGPLGWILAKLWIHRDVATIFEYRRKKIAEICRTQLEGYTNGF